MKEIGEIIKIRVSIGPLFSDFRCGAMRPDFTYLIWVI